MLRAAMERAEKAEARELRAQREIDEWKDRAERQLAAYEFACKETTALRGELSQAIRERDEALAELMRVREELDADECSVALPRIAHERLNELRGLRDELAKVRHQVVAYEEVLATRREHEERADERYGALAEKLEKAEKERDEARAELAALRADVDALTPDDTVPASLHEELRQVMLGERRRAEKAETTIAAIYVQLDLARNPAYSDKIALLADIKRLQDVARSWVKACELASVHCPVSSGESHVRSGIPKLAARCAQLECERDVARADCAELSHQLRRIREGRDIESDHILPSELRAQREIDNLRDELAKVTSERDAAVLWYRAAQQKGGLVVLNERPYPSRWVPIVATSPSGKRLFVCGCCGRTSTTPDKECPLWWVGASVRDPGKAVSCAQWESDVRGEVERLRGVQESMAGVLDATEQQPESEHDICAECGGARGRWPACTCRKASMSEIDRRHAEEGRQK
jgi:hypothetical protein